MRCTKLLACIILMTLGHIHLFGQGIELGLKGGVNFSNVSFDGEGSDIGLDYNPDLGYNIGFYIQFEISKLTSLGLEPGLNLKKVKSKDNDNAHVRLKYINVPVLLQYRLFDNMELALGPEFAFLIDKVWDVENIQFDPFDNYNDIELSIHGGLNFDLSDFLQIGLRYSQGISKLSEFEWRDEQGKLISQRNTTTSYAQIIGRYFF